MLQSSILTIEYQYTNVLKRVFTKVVSLLRKQHVIAQCKKPTAQMAHLVFPTHKPTLKNQKSHFFPTLDNQLKIIYYI
jgi:hypothetical protein